MEYIGFTCERWQGHWRIVVNAREWIQEKEERKEERKGSVRARGGGVYTLGKLQVDGLGLQLVGWMEGCKDQGGDGIGWDPLS